MTVEQLNSQYDKARYLAIKYREKDGETYAVVAEKLKQDGFVSKTTGRPIHLATIAGWFKGRKNQRINAELVSRFETYVQPTIRTVNREQYKGTGYTDSVEWLVFDETLDDATCRSMLQTYYSKRRKNSQVS